MTGRTITRILDYEGFAAKYAYAYLRDHHLALIAKHSPILEVGAGTGWWAAKLAALGADVVAHDPNIDRKSYKWFDVRPGNHNAAMFFPDRTLLMVWPSRDGDETNKGAWAHKAVRAYTRMSAQDHPQTVIYVGDPNFIETASPALPAALTEGGFTEQSRTRVASWPKVMDDWLIVYERTLST